MLKDELDNGALEMFLGDAAPWILAKSAVNDGKSAGERGVSERGVGGRGENDRGAKIIRPPSSRSQRAVIGKDERSGTSAQCVETECN